MNPLLNKLSAEHNRKLNELMAEYHHLFDNYYLSGRDVYEFNLRNQELEKVEEPQDIIMIVLLKLSDLSREKYETY